MSKYVFPLVLLLASFAAFWYFRNSDELLQAALDKDRAAFVDRIDPELELLDRLRLKQEALRQDLAVLEEEYFDRCETIKTSTLERIAALRTLSAAEPIPRRDDSLRRRALEAGRSGLQASRLQLRNNRERSLHDLTEQISGPQENVLKRKHRELDQIASQPVRGSKELLARQERLAVARSEIAQVRTRQINDLNEQLDAHRESLDGQQREMAAAIRETTRQLERLTRRPVAQGRSKGDPCAGLLRPMKHDLQNCRIKYVEKLNLLSNQTEHTLRQLDDACRRIEKLNQADHVKSEQLEQQYRERKWYSGMASGVLFGTMALVSLARFSGRRS